MVRMTELADEHPNYQGYRMICGLLVAEGWPVNKAAHRAFVAPRRPSGAPDEGQNQWSEGVG